jgi:hypothetical protein
MKSNLNLSIKTSETTTPIDPERISKHCTEACFGSTLLYNLKLFCELEPYIANYYIVETEILKNTQWHIFHIFTSEDIDHVTFSIYTIFCLGLYNKQNITRWLEDMTVIFSC